MIRHHLPFPVWVPFTPTLTASTGTITTVASVSGRYMRVGKGALIFVSGAITTNGTGAGTVRFGNLPFAAGAAQAVQPFSGIILPSFVDCIGFAGAGNTFIDIVKDDSSYPGANGVSFYASGFIELDV